MDCYHCGAANAPNFLTCAGCGRQRVIAAPGATSAPTTAAATPAPRTAMPSTTAMASTTAMPSTKTVERPIPTVIAAPGASLPGTTPAMTTSSMTGAATAPRGGRFARDATRYLCFAALTDSSYSRKIIREIVDEPHRAAASSPGIDLTTVLRYALASRRRHLVRDAILCLLIEIVYLAPTLFLLWLLAALITVVVDNLAARHGPLARQLRRGTFDPAKAPTFASSRLNNRLADIAAKDRGNVTIFPDYSPFFGYGVILDNWSFALNTAKAKDGQTVTPFTVEEVHDHITERVLALHLPGVDVMDRVLVNGADLLDQLPPDVAREILPNPLGSPEPSLSDASTRRLIGDTRGRARTYMCVRVAGWSGEVVLSVFLRFDLSPKKDVLFVEGSYSLLTPVRPAYQEIDRLSTMPTPWTITVAIGRSILTLPKRVFLCVPGLLMPIIRPLEQWRRSFEDRRAINTERSFNYGAKVSARELACDRQYYRYFQKLDKELYAKTVERRIFDALGDFLKDHGIDAAEFAERQTTILNNGVMVSGNASFDNANVAVGGNAIATKISHAGQAVSGAMRAGAGATHQGR